MAKQSAFLKRIQAQRDQELREVRGNTREGLAQIYLMAMLIAAHECLGVGPGRAGKFLKTFIAKKMEIAERLVTEVGSGKKGENGDPEYLVFRRDKTLELKRILSPEDWAEYKELFPLLQRYWEVSDD